MEIWAKGYDITNKYPLRKGDIVICHRIGEKVKYLSVVRLIEKDTPFVAVENSLGIAIWYLPEEIIKLAECKHFAKVKKVNKWI